MSQGKGKRKSKNFHVFFIKIFRYEVELDTNRAKGLPHSVIDKKPVYPNPSYSAADYTLIVVGV